MRGLWRFRPTNRFNIDVRIGGDEPIPGLFRSGPHRTDLVVRELATAIQATVRVMPDVNSINGGFR